MHRVLKSLVTVKLILGLTLLAGTGVLAAQVSLPGTASPTAEDASAAGLETANQTPAEPAAGHQSAGEQLSQVGELLDANADRLLATLNDAIARLEANGANQAAIDAVSAVRDAVAAGEHGLDTAAAAVGNAPAGDAPAHPSADNHPDVANHPVRP